MFVFYIFLNLIILGLWKTQQNPMPNALIHALCCPLSGIIMTDPVILPCSGVSYERSAIEEWIAKHSTDPMSGKPLQDARLIANPCLKSLIDSIIASVD